MKYICRLFIGIQVMVLFSSFNYDWKKIKIDRFSSEFPAEPSIEEQKIPSQVGELTIKMAMLQTEDNDTPVFGLMTTSYPKAFIEASKDSLNKLFRGSVDGAVKNVNGKLLSEKNIQFKGNQGRDVTIDYGGIAILRMKLYLVDNSMVIQQVIHSKDLEEPANASRFFNSLKID
jgi:hypothetical protein